MKAFVLRVAAVALAVCAIPNAADAMWLGTYSGSNQLTLAPNGGPGPLGDGIINFAVYDNINGDFSSIYAGAGTTQFGSGGVTAGRYIYLYQVVNTNPTGGDNPLTGMHLMVVDADIESAGVLADTVFVDAGGNVGPDGNRRLGTESVANNVALFGFTPTALATDSAAIETMTVTSTGVSLRFNFTVPPGVPTGSYSALLFVSANAAPTVGQGRLVDGDTTAGDVPVPTPEPGTLALLGLGLPVLGWGYRRRLRAAKVEAAQ